MKRWKITVEYDGSGFYGWQKQASGTTVQQVIEEAIFKFSSETIGLHVAGRTDTGVHARAQVAHFDLEKETTPDVVRDALNFHVKPHRVVILQAEQVTSNFHARFGATSRSYYYQIINRRPPLALFTDYAWQVPKPLNVDLMQEAADLLIGHHDFSTFRAQSCQSKSPMRTLKFLKVTREDDKVFIHVTAQSFLHHQVRNMVGTLVMVGVGDWSVDDFRKAFEAKDRTKGGPTAPAQGLFFNKVTYSEARS